MQTETIFRASRALEIVANVINYVGRPLGVQHSFRGIAGELFVTLTGRMVEDDGGLIELVERMNERANDVSTSSDERFTLEYVGGNIWRVEAA